MVIKYVVRCTLGQSFKHNKVRLLFAITIIFLVICQFFLLFVVNIGKEVMWLNLYKIYFSEM